MSRVLTSDCCDAKVLEIGDYQPVDNLHHYECACTECGRIGRFDVDADEDGVRCEWRAYPEHQQEGSVLDLLGELNGDADGSFEVNPDGDH